MNNPAATAYGGEFRAVKRDLPLASMRMLLCLTVFYGAVLTLTLPWTLYGALFREIGVGDRSCLATLGGGLLFAFSSLTMLRWCVVQSLAFWGYADLMRSKPSLD